MSSAKSNPPNSPAADKQTLFVVDMPELTPAELEQARPKAKKGLTPGQKLLARVIKWLDAHGVGFTVSSGTYVLKGTHYGPETLAAIMHMDKTVGTQVGEAFVYATAEHIRTALQLVAKDKRHAADAALRVRLDSKPQDDTRARLWLRTALDRNLSEQEFEECFGTFKQALWNVKRNIAGLADKYHVMPILWDPKGDSGKSENMALLLKPLDGFFLGDDFSILTDPRKAEALNTNYAVFLDEMPKADKADVDIVKRIVSAPTVPFKPLYTNTVLQLPRKATFFACTNSHPPHGLNDTSSGRRYYSLRAQQSPASEHAARQKFFEEFDVLDIWGCVDINAPAPLADAKLREAIRARQLIQNRKDTLLETFVKDELTPAEGGSISFASLHLVFVAWFESGSNAKALRKGEFTDQMRLAFPGQVTNSGNYAELKGFKQKASQSE